MSRAKQIALVGVAAACAVLTVAYLLLQPPSLVRGERLSMLVLARDGSILRGFLSADGTGGYAWLKDLTSASYTEARDDRYIAALDLPEGTSNFTLAYVVRAITPGT